MYLCMYMYVYVYVLYVSRRFNENARHVLIKIALPPENIEQR